MLRPSSFRYLLLPLAILACAFAAPGQTPAAALTFEVRTPGGAPIPNADVTAIPADSAEAVLLNLNGRPVNKFGLQATRYRRIFVTKTDENGKAQAPKADFQNSLPAVKIVVSVRTPGYQPFKQTIDLKEDRPVVITLIPLPPKQEQ